MGETIITKPGIGRPVRSPALRFVVISDTHDRHARLSLPQGDVLVHAGDITARGRKEDLKTFLAWFAAQPFTYRIFIAGNHDFCLEDISEAELQDLMPRGVIYLNDSGVTLGNLRVWGSPVTPWFFGWAFNRRRGADIRRHWEMIPSDTDLLITHGPVYGFLDVNGIEEHVGCQELLRRVLVIKPRVHICGHIHESYGSVRRSGIQFVNACVLNENGEPANPPVVFDINSI